MFVMGVSCSVTDHGNPRRHTVALTSRMTDCAVVCPLLKLPIPAARPTSGCLYVSRLMRSLIASALLRYSSAFVFKSALDFSFVSAMDTVEMDRNQEKGKDIV